MKYTLLLLILLLNFCSISAQQIQDKEQTKSQLALVYYNAKDYEKAIPLLLDVYEITRSRSYYSLYVNSLIELQRFEEAEQSISNEIAKLKAPVPDFLVYLGYILEKQDKNEESELKYNEAIELIQPNKGSYIVTANSFLQFGKYDYAEKIYLQGRKVIPPEKFNNELARVYLYLRKYDEMMEEYLSLLRANEKQLPRIQSSLSSAMRLDIDDGLRDKFRGLVLKKIQEEPDVIGYNRLLIWFFLQEKKFSSALRQAVALDKRTGLEDIQIFQLGEMALRSKQYDDAQKSYEYLVGKGDKSTFYARAFLQNINASYFKFTNEFPNAEEGSEMLIQKFENGLQFLGYNFATLQTILNYSHLLAFYLNNTEKAIEVLQKGLEVPRLNALQSGNLKTEMADIYLFANDPWEATLIYSQVIDANKNNSLGDDVKLKKAKLGYYIGNFSWAKAQLDVLKASTSKLTANDAMQLSMLIGNNLDLDTTAVPLEMFARADLLFFRNKDSLALATLDSIAEIYPYHTLVDDILFRKSKIEMGKQNYNKAAEYLIQISEDFSYDLLADDALFNLAELYNYNLNEKEKAKDLYKQMLVDFPGSVFVDESRKQYRELRTIYPDKENKEELFMNQGVVPNEFN